MYRFTNDKHFGFENLIPRFKKKNRLVVLDKNLKLVNSDLRLKFNVLSLCGLFKVIQFQN